MPFDPRPSTPVHRGASALLWCKLGAEPPPWPPQEEVALHNQTPRRQVRAEAPGTARLRPGVRQGPGEGATERAGGQPR